MVKGNEKEKNKFQKMDIREKKKGKIIKGFGK